MISALLSLSLALAPAEIAEQDIDDDGYRTEGHLLLGAGVFLGVASLTAFSVGFEAERVLRAERHTRFEADTLMFRRGLAAWFAWPTAALSAGSLAAGGTLLALDELDE